MSELLFELPPFLPTLLKDNITLWLDAADESTVTIATGVSQINDKSGNGYHATQATGSAQPVWTASNIGNKAALVFDDAHLMDIVNIPNTHLGFTSIVVCKFNQDSSANGFGNVVNVNGATAAVDERQPLHYYDKGNSRLNHSVGSFDAVLNTVSSGQDIISFIQYDGATTIKTSINSTTLASQAITQLTSSSAAGVIGQATMKGSVAEVIQYDRVLTTSEIAILFAYLSNKWGITI